MNVLDRICADKRTHIERKKAQTPLAALEKQLKDLPPTHGFIKSLQAKVPVALIAEVKKASPSKGIIRADFDPVAIAKIYEASGAACLSVLTDEPYFQGKDEYLQMIRRAVSLPLLRKDFMLDPYQIVESRALGADCVLLIMAALSDTEAKSLHTQAQSLGLDVLVEVHDAEELDRALAFSPAMIGINNRNLRTLEVNLETAIGLAQRIPPRVLKVAESGIETSSDVKKIKDCGFDAILVGESLMKQKDIGAAVRALLQGT